MRKILFFVQFFFYSQLLSAQSDIKALVGGYLINSNGDKPIETATIIINGNKIEAVGQKSRVDIPKDAEVIDLAGRFIIPGLVDAHMHFFQSGGLYTRPDGIDLNAYYPYEKEQEYIKANLEKTLARYLRSGITGVADVGGGMWNFEVREIANQTELAPRVVVAGPLISTVDRIKLDIGDPPIVKVTSIEEVDSLVNTLVAAKADLIKIWFIVSPDLDFESNLNLIKRTINQGHANGIRVAVHATQLSTAKESVRAGADILVHSVDDAEVDDEFIQLLKEKGTIYTSSMAVLEGYKKIMSQDLALSNNDYEIADPIIMNNLLDLQHIPEGIIPERLADLLDDPDDVIERSDGWVKMAKTNLKKLQDAGVTIATGTDAGNPGTFHGSAIYREFELMTEAGLSPNQIIVNSTLNGSKLMGLDNQIGSLEVGKLADMVILNSNPMEDISNTSDISVVVKNGNLYEPDQILPPTPTDVVQKQVLAYNQRDLNRFLSFYSDDVQMLDKSNKLILEGKEEMEKRYRDRFKSKNLHVEIVNRSVIDNKVVDAESVTGIDDDVVRATAVYEITDGLISKVWIISLN